MPGPLSHRPLPAACGRKVLLTAGLLLLPIVFTKWISHFFPHLLSPSIHLWLGLLYIGFVASHLLRYILGAARVDAEVLCAGISVYLMIGLPWTLAYMLIAHFSEGAFPFINDPDSERTMTSFNAFYFSFTTLSTVGFGDISPVSKLAMTGMFYMAVLISRLVAMYSPAAGPRQEP